MTESASAPVVYSGRTAWARKLQTPLRQFLRTETGSAAVLLAATVTALAWVNIDAASYRTVWDTRLSVSLGSASLSQDLGELGQLRPDDVLLPGGGPGSAARVRHGRAARAPPPGSAPAGRRGRDDRADRDLPADQRRPPVGARLGNGDVHRHRVRPRGARADRQAPAGPGPYLPAHVLRRRRPRRHRGHRLRLQRADPRRRAADRSGHPRGHGRAAGGQAPLRPGVRAARGGGVDRDLQIRRRPGAGRPRDGAADLRAAGHAQRPGAGLGPVPAVPRAADAGAGPVGARGSADRAVAQRPAAADLPPADQLRHRPAVRARATPAW